MSYVKYQTYSYERRNWPGQAGIRAVLDGERFVFDLSAVRQSDVSTGAAKAVWRAPASLIAAE
jgi:hypothetical protein